MWTGVNNSVHIQIEIIEIRYLYRDKNWLVEENQSSSISLDYRWSLDRCSDIVPRSIDRILGYPCLVLSIFELTLPRWKEWKKEKHAVEFIRGLTGRKEEKKKKKDIRHVRMRILLSNLSKSKSKERKILHATRKSKRQCCPVLFSYLFIYLVFIRWPDQVNDHSRLCLICSANQWKKLSLNFAYFNKILPQWKSSDRNLVRWFLAETRRAISIIWSLHRANQLELSWWQMMKSKSTWDEAFRVSLFISVMKSLLWYSSTLGFIEGILSQTNFQRVSRLLIADQVYFDQC